jgi:tRNA A37 N6-isopentenylltransferase MiaA
MRPSGRSVTGRDGNGCRARSAYEVFRERAITATRQLAKRQLTWLRGMEGLERLPAERTRVDDLLARVSMPRA